MATMVRDLPADERPREKLLAGGASLLSDVELLAILLRTGTRTQSVLHLAEEILAKYKDRGLVSVVHMAPEELAGVKGIGMAKAATVLAAVELGRRIAFKAAEVRDVIHGPEDVAAYAMPHFRYELREHFAIMLLNTKNHVLGMPIISVGSLSASIVHPREVFRVAIQQAAASIILLHNHPSGDPSPSEEDISVTRQLMKVGKIMDIPVLDHVIIGDNKFVSLKEQRILSHS